MSREIKSLYSLTYISQHVVSPVSPSISFWCYKKAILVVNYPLLKNI